MNIIKTIFKNTGTRVWLFVSLAVIALLLVVTILMSTTFYSIMSTVLGGRTPVFDTGSNVVAAYESEYTTKQASYEAGNALNVEIAEEGFTLLVNEGGLPIKKTAKVSVFGKNSVNLVLGGSGSGGISGEAAKTIFDGLTAAEISYNPTLKAFYEDNRASGSGRSSNPTLTTGATTAPTLDIGETPVSSYTDGVLDSFEAYHDAALVVISRIGGESFDLPRAQADDPDRHYLQLDANEYAMLDMVTSEFDNVIVLLNVITAFQCDFIAQYNNMQNDPRIDAVLWIGGPGSTGAEALGSILTGETNPSGKTVDIYSADYTKDPTWENFGDYSQTNGGEPLKNGNAVAAYLENGTQPSPSHYMLTYEEGVYVGYRYYETRGFDDEDWYEENVIFPFGHGLSYTTFGQKITSVTGTVSSGVTIDVEVKNTGDAAGKDVVQLYVSLPYITGGIEKSHVQLVDYAKTGLLSAKGSEGDSEKVNFTVDAYDLASYDYNDANNNGFAGYELDAGDYTFFISANSHVTQYAYDSTVMTLDEALRFEKDPTTNAVVENLYTTDDLYDSAYRMNDFTVNNQTRKGMSRTNWTGTWPSAPTAEERWYEEGERALLLSTEHNNKGIAAEAAEKGMPATGKDVLDIDIVGDDGVVTGQRAIMLRDVVGLDHDDDKWQILLDRLTVDEMAKLANNGAFLTEAIESIGKPLTNDSDGPIGFVNFMMTDNTYKNNTTFAAQIVIASTWSKDLAFRMGKAVGDNAVWGGIDGNGLPYSGWYAPAVNIHRSPFSGRNFEYYSEDPVLSGKMAVNVINGAKTMGVYTDLKHFAVNDQETNRAGVATYLTEQSLREIYLKPFEIAVKGDDVVSKAAKAFAAKREIQNYTYTGTTGMMSSFNRIGTIWTGGDYRLMTQILRDEWGFKGVVICDYKTESYMGSKQMVYAGNDLILTSTNDNRWTGYEKNSAEDVIVLRKAAHNILYAVANSNAMNRDILDYIMPWWQILLIVVTAASPLLFGVWGFFAIRKALKKQKQEKGIT